MRTSKQEIKTLKLVVQTTIQNMQNHNEPCCLQITAMLRRSKQDLAFLVFCLSFMVIVAEIIDLFMIELSWCENFDLRKRMVNIDMRRNIYPEVEIDGFLRYMKI